MNWNQFLWYFFILISSRPYLLLDKFLFYFLSIQKVEDFSDGCGAKYNILVVSEKFTGKSLLQRQR